jgi:uncharacterized metal-binding protein
MPTGKVHAFASVAAAVAVPIVASHFIPTTDWKQMLAGSAGCLMGLIVTPDLDVDRGCRAFHVVEETVGKIPALIWRIIWLPYSWLIPHRSPLSHLPLIGTALRLGYLLGAMLLIWYLASQTGVVSPVRLQGEAGLLSQPLLWWLIIGLALSDGLHFLMDITLRNE